MKSIVRDLQSIVDNEARDYAIYTVENRAIPNMIDGLKPVQRFVMYSALVKGKSDKKKFRKVADIGSGVADFGYHHGETSAQEAACLIASTWNNNIPILEGQGNFGSRLVQEAGAARYVFCRVHENFFNIYKDVECAPVHEDPEHLPPAFYLPVIPMVLANGVSGIATGHATDIMPHSFKSLVQCTKLALKGKLNKEPEVHFPKFNGNIVPRTDRSGVLLEGTYELNGKTKLVITEVPVKYDRETYVAILDDLEEKNVIVGYNDRCSKDGFKFEVTLKRDYFKGDDKEANHNKIMKDFKLVEKVAQNITVIDENHNVRVYEKASDLIKDFVKIRLHYVEKRIEHKKAETLEAFNYAKAKAIFIGRVLKGECKIQGIKKAEAIENIKAFPELEPYADRLISLSLYTITTDEAAKLVEEAKKYKADHDYWLNTTAEIEYTKDLDAL